MKFLLTIIWVLVWSMTYSQENTPAVQDQIVNQIGKDGYAGAVQTYDTRYEGVKGTPFLSEKWQPGSFTRSEERRVGKECRSRWSPYH